MIKLISFQDNVALYLDVSSKKKLKGDLICAEE
jgi:hypothetical protein